MDRQTDRHTDRQTHRQTDRHTQTDRQTDTHRQTDRHTDRQTDRTNHLSPLHTHGVTNRYTISQNIFWAKTLTTATLEPRPPTHLPTREKGLGQGLDGALGTTRLMEHNFGTEQFKPIELWNSQDQNNALFNSKLATFFRNIHVHVVQWEFTCIRSFYIRHYKIG